MSGHRAYQLYAHITWHTWKRVGCLDRAAVADLRSAIASSCSKTGVKVLRGAVLADHVHLLVSFRPDTRLSDFIRLAKSVAAVRANGRIPGAVRWARGFYVASVHKSHLPRVLAYIARQYERHPELIPRKVRTDTLTPGASPGKGREDLARTDPGRKPGETNKVSSTQGVLDCR